MPWKDAAEGRTYNRRYYREKRDGTWVRTIERDTTPRASLSPSLSDLAWAAGFLEGEGSFRKYPNGGQVVDATQVEREPLDRLQAMFGGIISLRPLGPRNRQAPHRWQVFGARARGVMLTIYSFMSTKRRKQICRAALKSVSA